MALHDAIAPFKGEPGLHSFLIFAHFIMTP